VDVVPDLLDDLETDTSNVLLTLARVAHTLATGAFASKDGAADWALPRVSGRARPALQRARGVYVGAERDSWDELEAEVNHAAGELRELIQDLREPDEARC
jgi:streptomycin 3"-adenylyltransferase